MRQKSLCPSVKKGSPLSQAKPLKKVALPADAVAERTPSGHERQSAAPGALNIAHKRPIPGSPSADALAAGVGSTPAHNLHFRGGRTIQGLTDVNLYVGGQAARAAADIQKIDRALAAAMTDSRLERPRSSDDVTHILSRKLVSAASLN